MVRASESLIQDIQNVLKLPRENGEMIFHNPWESRVFAMAVLLFEKGGYSWKVFQEEFAEMIGEAESQKPDKEFVSDYYHHWMQALEKVLLKKEMLTQEQLQTRSDEFEKGQRHHVC
jgi:nitrile hydratase accessory protein